MSIMDKLFGAFQAPQQQQPSQAQQQQAPNPNAPALPGNIPAVNNNPASPNNPTAPAAAVAATGNTPNNGAAAPEPQGLDKFTDLWNLTDAQKPQAHESPFANVTPEALQKIAGQTDFSKVVTPEMMTAISAGGEQAAAAMIQAMNAVAQQTYAQSAEASIKLINKAVETNREQLLSELPTLVKQQNVTDNLRTKNPIFNHPAAKPMLETLQQQLQLKNPTATAEQIRSQAEEFLIGFAQSANPQQQQQQQQSGPNKSGKGQMDWSDWT